MAEHEPRALFAEAERQIEIEHLGDRSGHPGRRSIVGVRPGIDRQRPRPGRDVAHIPPRIERQAARAGDGPSGARELGKLQDERPGARFFEHSVYGRRLHYVAKALQQNLPFGTC